MKPKPNLRTCLGAATAALLTFSSGVTQAHDSWFARLGSLNGGEPLLAFGTGNQFPVYDFSVDPRYLAREGCRFGDGRARPLRTVRIGSTALVLRPGQPGAIACWIQLQPFDVEVEAGKVGLYLDEINASPALRGRWAALQARGVPWRERYTKHARVELQAGAGQPPAGETADMAVDLRRVSGSDPGNTRPGDTLVFQLRRDDRPMAGIPIELRHAGGSASVWLETDPDGRVTVQPGLAGEWILRGVDLRLSPTRPDTWESDFITLSFGVLAP